jgi:hypothetical protein
MSITRIFFVPVENKEIYGNLLVRLVKLNLRAPRIYFSPFSFYCWIPDPQLLVRLQFYG